MAFFSGTDDNALKQEGMATPHFLSLVVDTKGTYVARITQRITTTKTIEAEVTQSKNYPTYEGKIVEIDNGTTTHVSTSTASYKIIAYDVKVNIQNISNNPEAEWEDDLQKASKSGMTTPTTSISKPSSINTWSTTNNAAKTFTPYYTSSGNKVNVKEPVHYKEHSLFEEYEDFEDSKDYKDFKSYGRNVSPLASKANESTKQAETDHSKSQKEKENFGEVSSYDELSDALASFQKSLTTDILSTICYRIVCCDVFAEDITFGELRNSVALLPKKINDIFTSNEDYCLLRDSIMEMVFENYIYNNCLEYAGTEDEILSVLAQSLYDLCCKLPQSSLIDRFKGDLCTFII